MKNVDYYAEQAEAALECAEDAECGVSEEKFFLKSAAVWASLSQSAAAIEIQRRALEFTEENLL